MKETLFTLASDAALRVVGGNEWSVDVTLDDGTGNPQTETVVVVARSQEEAEDLALVKAKATCFAVEEPERSTTSKILSVPYNKAGRKRMFMPGGYVPGSMIKGAISNIKDNLTAESSDRIKSDVSLDIRSRNCFISLIVHLLLFPVGILFMYAGLYASNTTSTVPFLNQHVVAGLLCFTVGGIGGFRAARDMLRFEKIKAINAKQAHAKPDNKTVVDNDNS